MPPHSPPYEPPPWFVIKVTAIASLGGTLFGYDMGAIAGALPQLAQTFELTESQQEWVVSILYLGGGFGACVGGALCDWVGRQRTILWTDCLFMLGAVWLYWANSYPHVLLGRFVVGVAVAVSGIADVSYLHEIAPLQWRGAIVSVNEACISLGFLLAFLAGYCYQSDSEAWRLIFGWAGILALVQWLGMLTLPESPIWLAEQGRIKESRQAWQQINHSTCIPIIAGEEGEEGGTSSLQEYQGSENTISVTHQQQHLEALGENTEAGPEQQQTLSLLMTLHRYRRQVYIALFLAVTQQFCGQTNVLNYAPHIFAQAAAEDEPPAWSTLAIGGAKFAVTVLVIWRIEFLGRRTLLLGGMTLISVGLLALVVAFGGSKSDDPDSWYTNLKTFDLALPGVLLVVCGYSMSFGPLTWLLTSELFPTEIRGRALGTSTIVTYLCASFVTRTFLSAQSILGPAKVFAIYCLLNTVGIIFAYLAIPDTGEKTVDQIETTLQQSWWWRHDIGALLSQMDEADGEVVGEQSLVLRTTPCSPHDMHTFQTDRRRPDESSSRGKTIELNGVTIHKGLPELT